MFISRDKAEKVKILHNYTFSYVRITTFTKHFIEKLIFLLIMCISDKENKQPIQVSIYLDNHVVVVLSKVQIKSSWSNAYNQKKCH